MLVRRVAMRVASVMAVSFLISSVSYGAGFSQVRDLPPLKMGAKNLDAILLKTHSLLDAANGSDELGRESVKIDIHSQDIEIPHLSVASSLAFPNELFGFSYMYQQAGKPISSVTIELGDSSRRISVSGESADKVDELSKLLEKDFRRYSTPVGGLKFRRIAGICLSMLFLSSLMISGAYCWNNRNCRVALGMPICAAIGFVLVLLLPWNRFLPGFVLYQHYSPFFLVRHASEILLVCLAAVMVGIPLFYVLSQSSGSRA
jgi:hypothetical protein